MYVSTYIYIYTSICVYVCIHTHINITLTKYDNNTQQTNSTHITCSNSIISFFTDGIGTPDPNPKHLVNWCF